MADLNDEIAAYDAMRGELETEHLGKWVLVRDKHLQGVFETFDGAVVEAVARFGRGPYLIRQVGTPPAPLPASVMYRPIHALSAVRLQHSS